MILGHFCKIPRVLIGYVIWSVFSEKSTYVSLSGKIDHLARMDSFKISAVLSCLVYLSCIFVAEKVKLKLLTEKLIFLVGKMTVLKLEPSQPIWLYRHAAHIKMTSFLFAHVHVIHREFSSGVHKVLKPFSWIKGAFSCLNQIFWGPLWKGKCPPFLDLIGCGRWTGLSEKWTYL